MHYSSSSSSSERCDNGQESQFSVLVLDRRMDGWMAGRMRCMMGRYIHFDDCLAHSFKLFSGCVSSAAAAAFPRRSSYTSCTQDLNNVPAVNHHSLCRCILRGGCCLLVHHQRDLCTFGVHVKKCPHFHSMQKITSTCDSHVAMQWRGRWTANKSV